MPIMNVTYIIDIIQTFLFLTPDAVSIQWLWSPVNVAMGTGMQVFKQVVILPSSGQIPGNTSSTGKNIMYLTPCLLTAPDP